MPYDKKPYKKFNGKTNREPFTMNHEPSGRREPFTMNHEPSGRHEPFTMNHEPSGRREPFTMNHEPSGRREPFTMNHEPSGRPEPKRKRGKLAPLMPEEAKATASIHELSFDFGCRITRLFQYLTEDAEYKEYVQSKQIYRSGTSIGANVRESKHAQSEADFLSKMSIAYKEADETDFWLNLLHDNGYLNDEQFNSLNKDMTRILKILTSIVKTLNEKVKKK